MVYNNLRPSIARIREGTSCQQNQDAFCGLDNSTIDRPSRIDSPHALLQAAIAACPRGTRTLRASGAAPLPDDDSERWEQSDAYEGASTFAEVGTPSPRECEEREGSGTTRDEERDRRDVREREGTAAVPHSDIGRRRPAA